MHAKADATNDDILSYTFFPPLFIQLFLPPSLSPSLTPFVLKYLFQGVGFSLKFITSWLIKTDKRSSVKHSGRIGNWFNFDN